MVRHLGVLVDFAAESQTGRGGKHLRGARAAFTNPMILRKCDSVGAKDLAFAYHQSIRSAKDSSRLQRKRLAADDLLVRSEHP